MFSGRCSVVPCHTREANITWAESMTPSSAASEAGCPSLSHFQKARHERILGLAVFFFFFFVVQSPGLVNSNCCYYCYGKHASMTTARTANDIRRIMDALQLDAVARHFNQDADADVDADAEDIDPYVVCDGVSVRAFNKYVGDGEGLPIALRFLVLDNGGRILIVELPTTVHESTARNFERRFLAATGNGRDVASRGSMTASVAGRPRKEADATFGPFGDTPHRTPPPAPRTNADWITLAVEVGRSQSWASLVQAAQWWCGYDGIQYILLLKISRLGFRMQYALYDIVTTGILPPPSAGGLIYRHTVAQPAVNVSFDMHRVLSIPADRALPAGVNATAVVDLRAVMNLVIRTLGPA